MDKQPQRPRAALRVTDENVPLANVHAGKTLHHRTKSVPAFSSMAPIAVKTANKKVLGEANKNAMNVKPVHQDDIAIGKASPGKLKAQAEIAPATRMLPIKPLVTVANKSNVSTAVTVPELVTKKSVKVLKDIASVKADTDAKTSNVSVPVKPMSTVDSLAVRSQEPTTTDSVPMTEQSSSALINKVVDLELPQGFTSKAQYIQHLNHVDDQLRQMAVDGILPHATESCQCCDGDDHEEGQFDDDYTTAGSWMLRGDLTCGHTTLVNPNYTVKNEADIAAAKLFVDCTRTPEDIEDEEWDMSMVAQYSDEIFEYMRGLESQMVADPHYMDKQLEVQWPMRGVLIDWVVQVHGRFNLLPETLFLSVNYIDRFLSVKVVSLGKLQLVGATAIFVAAKYEEVNCPTITEMIYMVDGGYTAEEMIKAERYMLTMLKFELGWPGPMSFLRRISKADDYDLETRTLAKYFLEVTIMDPRFIGLMPSFLAAGAHCMARFMLQKGEWSQAHVYYSNYTLPQLKKLLRAIKECCQQGASHHQSVFDKYTEKRFKRSSHYVAEQLARGFRLPFERESLEARDAYGLLKYH